MDSNPILAEYDARRAKFEAFASRLAEVIQQILTHSEIRAQSVEQRTKSRQSLAEKVARPSKNYSRLDEITDVCGVRIITYFAQDVDRVAEILKREFDVDSANSTDRRIYDDPDRFGYQSLHYVLTFKTERAGLTEYSAFRGYKAEVQVRTLIQHAWAEIEHDLGYKNTVAVPRELRRRLFRLAAMLEIADNEFTLMNEARSRYRMHVKEQLQERLGDVNVDTTSVAEFVSSDAVVIEVERELSTRTGLPIAPIHDQGASAIAAWLSNVGFATVDEVRQNLARFRSDILRVASKRVQRSQHHEIGAGISLLYLCYAVLAHAVPNPINILRFLEANGFDSADGLPAFADAIFDEFTHRDAPREVSESDAGRRS